jgi:hypothetical protein
VRPPYNEQRRPEGRRCQSGLLSGRTCTDSTEQVSRGIGTALAKLAERHDALALRVDRLERQLDRVTLELVERAERGRWWRK